MKPASALAGLPTMSGKDNRKAGKTSRILQHMQGVAAFTLLLVILMKPAGAQTEDISNWPRMDVLELLAPERAVVEQLLREDFIVDTEHPHSVKAHVTAEQRAELDRRRIPYVKIGQEPNPPVFGAKTNLGQYHSYDAMTARLQGYVVAYPEIARLVSLGDSVQGRVLWAMRITDNPDVEEDEPEFKYVSTIHGDEPVGTELCLYLIDLLLTSYNTESVQGARLTELVNGVDIWIVPMVNPDGRMAGARGNANGRDLNRNFPSYVFDALGAGNVFDGDPLDTEGRQIETVHVMRWVAENSFVLSANLHTGALLVNYPFDEGDGVPNSYQASPDDPLFVDISTRYAVNNPPMYNSPSFPNGISNGSDWYTIYGGMQDWNYRYASCNEVTLELSNTKTPTQSTLPTFWENNRESMLAYMESVRIGIRGLVTDGCTGEPVYAKVTVAGNAQPVYTDPDVGDYHRMLLPGSYTVTISAPGYQSTTLTDVNVGSGLATQQDVALERIELPAGGCDPVEGEGEGGADEGEDAPEGESPPHTADQNSDFQIDLSEMLRVIQLYSAYRFQCDANGEDGFAPFGGECLGCAAHTTDYNPRDCVISLSELLRGIQIFSAGGYTPCPGNAEGDGYCPLP